MKYSSFFYAIVLLLVSPFVALAADITLKDVSTASSKSISVDIDTGTEKADSIKVVIETSSDVTISDIEEAELNCSTFSSPQNGNIVELICTLPSEQTVKGSLAKIGFTTTGTDYTFTVQKASSQIGTLTIEDVTDIGTTNPTTTEPTTTTTTTTPPTQTKPVATTGKPTGFAAYLPYILLGAAGIFLISIIVLLVTKKSEPAALADVPAPTTPTVTTTSTETTPTTPPTDTGVDLNNIPENLQNVTQEDNLTPTPAPTPAPTSKPTLQEIVNQPAQQPTTEPVETPNTTQPIETPSATQPATQPNEQQDLQELLSKEVNSSVAEPVLPQDNPESPVIADNYVADTNQGLPNIGFISPEDPNGTREPVMEISRAPEQPEPAPLNEIPAVEPQPTPATMPDFATPVTPQMDTIPVETDLQQIADQEISTMQAATPEQPQDPTQPIQPQI